MRRSTKIPFSNANGFRKEAESGGGAKEARWKRTMCTAVTVLFLIVLGYFGYEFMTQSGLVSYAPFRNLQVEGGVTVEVDTAAEKDGGRCKRGYLYVYKLPKKMNEDLVRSCPKDEHKLYAHKGLGEQAFPKPKKEDVKNLTRLFVDSGRWFDSRAFGIDVAYHARLLQHPCRTDDPGKAAVFFLPFYADVALRRTMDLRNESASNKLPDEFVGWLEKQPYFLRNGGHDHFLVVGESAYQHMSSEGDSWGSHLLKRPAMENVTKLASFRAPWEGTQMGVPFLTNFHPSTDSQLRAWQHSVRRAKRNRRVSFIGSTMGAANLPKAALKLRTDLIKQCKEWEKCRVLDCQDAGQGKKSTCHEITPSLRIQLSSDFCLQPPGETPVHKSTFDTMVAGCIPVFFTNHSAYHQYLWHLPAERERYSVFIDERELAAGNVTLRGVLSGFGKDEIRRMRRFVIDEILPGIVVADPDKYRLVEAQDAVDRAVEGMMTKVARLRAGLKHLFPNRWDLDNLPPHEAYTPLQPPVDTA